MNGENALEPEHVSEKLHQNTFWMGRGGTLTHTISGIDIALWDILGKAMGQPVGRLLGGVYRVRVRPYCSLLMDEPAAMSDTLARFRAQGFRAFKIGWGPFGRCGDSKLDEAIVKAARDAGASGWQTFFRVTLPNIKWGLLYGVILCNARAMGEFGAVSVVSGHIRGKTNTIPLHVEILYNEYNVVAAFTMASILALLGLVTLAAKTFFEWKIQQELKSTLEPATAEEGAVIVSE
jgi:hypothetical protein